VINIQESSKQLRKDKFDHGSRKVSIMNEFLIFTSLVTCFKINIMKLVCVPYGVQYPRNPDKMSPHRSRLREAAQITDCIAVELWRPQFRQIISKKPQDVSCNTRNKLYEIFSVEIRMRGGRGAKEGRGSAPNAMKENYPEKDA
jgi:hypothetical protein